MKVLIHAKSILKSLTQKVKTYKFINNLHFTDINLYAVFVAWIIQNTGLTPSEFKNKQKH